MDDTAVPPAVRPAVPPVAHTAVRLEADATASASALSLRPWRREDAAALAGLYGDPALRRWTRTDVEDEAGAARWLEAQRLGWETGRQLAFAVLEVQPGHGEGVLAGHVVLKTSDGASAQVGYWTLARARGRGVAPRALRALTDWALASFSGLNRLELLHQVDNTASCRVAEKTGYAFEALLPAAAPEFPLDGHLHARVRGG